MLIALLILVGANEQVTARPSASVRASAMIVRAEPVTAELWKHSQRKAERIYVEPNGKRVLLRTIEHE